MKKRPRSPITDRRTRTAALLAAAIAVSVLLCGWVYPAGAENAPPAPTVTIPGQLEASDAVWLGRLTQMGDRSADVIEKIVPEGTAVKRGDFVFQLDAAPLQRSVEGAQAQVTKGDLLVESTRAKLDTLRGQLKTEQAKAPARLAPSTLEVERLAALPDPMDVSAAEMQLKSAQAALDDAQTKLQALEQLAAQDMVSQQALETARSDAEIAAAERDKAQAALDGVRLGADPYDLQVARLNEQKVRLQTESDTAVLAAQVRGAEITLIWAKRGAILVQKRLETYQGEQAMATRFAPQDGIVVYAPAREGGKVGPGASIYQGYRVAAVTSGKSFRFRGKANESVLARIRPGLAARVHVDAMPDAVLSGRVEAFDVSLSEDKSARPDAAGTERTHPRVFEVLVALHDVPAGLLPGMGARAEVQLDTATPAESALSAQVAKSWGRGTGNPVPLLLGGFVSPAESAPVFVLSDLAGYVTFLAEPYSHVEAGDPIMECTGDKARARLLEIEEDPKFAQDLLDAARVYAEQDDGQRRAQVQSADLDVQIARARLEQASAPARECDLRSADADVRKARAALEKARRTLAVEQAAGLASRATLGDRELDVQRAQIALEDAQFALATLRSGATEEKVRLAKFRVARAEKEKALLEEAAAGAVIYQQGLVQAAEVHLGTANKRVRDARTLYDNRVVRSPIAGNVVFNPEPGYGSGRLRLGDTVPVIVIEAAYVADLSKLRFCAVLEQARLSSVHVGQQAQVELLALPGRVLTGRVASMMPLVMDREEVLSPEGSVAAYSGVRSSKAEIALDLPADLVGRILPSMTGLARILPDGNP